MASRAESISEIRNLLGEPYENAPSLHRILGSYLRMEGQLFMKLNNTGVAWAVKTFDLVSDPDTDTYGIEVSNVPIADFGKPLFVMKSTGDSNLPFIEVLFNDLRDQRYGIIPEGVSDVTPPTIYTPAMERLSFYREGAINPVNKVKINPVPQTAQTYKITYSVGNVGRDDDLDSTYAIPELAAWVELHTAMSLLPYCKWSDDMAVNEGNKKELASSFAFQLETVNRNTDIYLRDIVHPRVVEVDVCY